MIEYLTISSFATFAFYHGYKACKSKYAQKILATHLTNIAQKSHYIGSEIAKMFNENKINSNNDHNSLVRFTNSYINHFHKNLGTDLEKNANSLNSLVINNIGGEESLILKSLSLSVEIGNNIIESSIICYPEEFNNYFYHNKNFLGIYTFEFVEELHIEEIIADIPSYAYHLEYSFAGTALASGASLIVYNEYDDYIYNKTQEFYHYLED